MKLFERFFQIVGLLLILSILVFTFSKVNALYEINKNVDLSVSESLSKIGNKLDKFSVIDVNREKRQIINQKAVLTSIKNISELATINYGVESFIDLTELSTSILASDKEMSIISTGVVKAGYDMSKLRVETNYDDLSIKVYMPHPQILSVDSNPRYHKYRGNFSASDHSYLLSRVKQKMRATAITEL